ncbi:MAG: hypothetical protein WD075_07890 [Rhodospirillales bacterium]
MLNPYLKKGAVAGLMVVMAQSASAGTVSNSNKVDVTLGGYVNRALLWGDDGESSRAFVVDNENLSSRFFIAGEGKVNERLTAGVYMEFDFRDNSSSTVTLDDANAGDGGVGGSNVGATTFSQRHMDTYISDAVFGKLSLGQGASASDGVAEVDKSGTGIVAYSGIADMAAAMKYRTDAGGFGPAIGSTSSNMDGLGLTDRVRYDTPAIGGFGLATSYVSGGAADVSVTFGGKFASVDVGAALGYWNNNSISTSDDGGMAGSVSMKHDSGISLTLAGGKTMQKATNRDDPTFGYGKLAYTVGLTSLGDTSFGVDYGVYNDVAQNSDEMITFGLQVVQDLAATGTSLYIGYRNHELDRPGSNFNDVDAVMTGINVAF